MYLRKWNDVSDPFTQFQSDLDSLFNRSLGLKRTAAGPSTLTRGEWYPAVDIHEDKEAYFFDVEAPGIAKENLDVNVENRVLTIKGERKSEEEKKEKNFHRIEREYGAFTRAFTLPDTADTDKVNAEYKNGVLNIKIAKKSAALPKSVPVTVS